MSKIIIEIAYSRLDPAQKVAFWVALTASITAIFVMVAQLAS